MTTPSACATSSAETPGLSGRHRPARRGRPCSAASSAPTATQGTDADKKIVGRKRDIVTDTLGRLLAVMVTSSGLSEGLPC
ncbi:hypothetical protein [Planomonospora parontospora]|uniref:hypothetical protein n=1 Tax=Planomonospora parontospora TaxID=58119 RepID=UPI0035A2447A